MMVKQINRLKREAPADDTPATPTTDEQLLAAINRLNEYLASKGS